MKLFIYFIHHIETFMLSNFGFGSGGGGGDTRTQVCYPPASTNLKIDLKWRIASCYICTPQWRETCKHNHTCSGNNTLNWRCEYYANNIELREITKVRWKNKTCWHRMSGKNTLLTIVICFGLGGGRNAGDKQSCGEWPPPPPPPPPRP